MIPDKVELTRGIKSIIVGSRKDTGLSSYDFSEKIGKSKYWFANLENGKSKYVTKDDLFSIIRLAKNINDEEIENLIQNIIDESTINTDQQIEFIAPSSEEKRDYTEEFNKVVDNIVAGFNIIYKNVDDKEYTIELLKRLNKNMHSNLGYSLSIFSLPWCHFSNLDKDKKLEIIDDIFEMINKKGHKCKDCKLCKDKEATDNEEDQ